MEVDAVQYCVSDGVLARSVGDTVILFHPESERLFSLHETGVRIWQIMAEQPEVDQIVARLIEEYEGSGIEIQQQVIEFLSKLEAERIIRRTS